VKPSQSTVVEGEHTYADPESNRNLPKYRRKMVYRGGCGSGFDDECASPSVR
jgi:hypothetical protein